MTPFSLDCHITIRSRTKILSLFCVFLSGMVKHITGGYKVTYHPDGPEGEAHEIDFTPPFRRVSMTHDLEKLMGVKFPPTDSYDSDGKISIQSDLCCWYSFCFKQLALELSRNYVQLPFFP